MQTFPLITHQLLVADNPVCMLSAAGLALLGVDPAVARPFAAGEFSLPNEPGEFCDIVPVLDGLPLHQQGEHLFHSREALIKFGFNHAWPIFPSMHVAARVEHLSRPSRPAKPNRCPKSRQLLRSSYVGPQY
jgi:hypothetical protein